MLCKQDVVADVDERALDYSEGIYQVGDCGAPYFRLECRPVGHIDLDGKKRGMPHTEALQFSLVPPQRSNDAVAVHAGKDIPCLSCLPEIGAVDDAAVGRAPPIAVNRSLNMCLPSSGAGSIFQPPVD
jgi:hypothetical protein